ncbi:MAG TPA: hypothetical protein VIF37_19205 [Methylobacter sp.]|jgi:hypothetical protein
MMKIITIIGALTTISLLSGCALLATTEYKLFEGKLDGVIDGNGGTKAVVDDMEIWFDGEPPRKFKILGFIDDNRESDWIRMLSLQGDIVDEAREAGGEAIIKLNSQSQLARFYSAGGASSNSYASPAFASSVSMSNRRHLSKYAVIKYVQ